MEQFDVQYVEKIIQFLDGIDLNCSSSRCFQGHLNPQVTGLHVRF